MNFFVFVISFFVSNISAYEKIDFIGQISDSTISSAVSVAKENNLFYVLSKDQISVYNSSFTFVSKTTLPSGSYCSITASKEKIYVLDCHSSLISVYSLKGEFLFSFGAKGKENGQLSDPSDIKFFNGKVYIANRGASKIEVFDSNGIYLYGFPLVSRDGLKKISPSNIYIDRSGFIYVSDSNSKLIQKYDLNGRLESEKNIASSALAVNDYGLIYLAWNKDGKVKELDRDFSDISSFGTKGRAKFEFLSFADLEVDENGDLIILDPKNKKIMVLKLENSKHLDKLSEAQEYSLLKLNPSNSYPISAHSFAFLGDSLSYYDKKDKKVYLISGESKKAFLGYGEAEGSVKDPADMVFNSSKLYVSDTGNGRVQIFSKDGKYNSFFGGKVGFLEKNKEGKFSSPVSIACDLNGKIYVADSGFSMVQAFNKDGIFLFTVGPEIGGIKLLKPSDVKVDENNTLYILDSELKKVIVVDSNGKYINSWDISALSKPVSFDYDGMGYFYFLDREKSNVSVYGKKGNYISSFFAKGHGKMEFYEPTIVRIYGEKLFVSDPANSKLASYDMVYFPPKPENVSAKISSDSVEVSWTVANSSFVKKFDIYKGKSPDGLKKVDSVKTVSWTDSSLKDEGTFYYRIASSGKNDEIFSDMASVYFEGIKKKVEEPAVESDASFKNKPPVEIVPVELNYIFSANYKYYIDNPVGKVLVKNNTEENFSNVKVSFFLKDYMDFPSDIIIPELKSMSSSYVELKATLNNRILTINEDTPVQAQLTVSYYRDGKENQSLINKPIKILSKNAITWDNTERIANFVTVKDPPVYAFSRAMLAQKSKFDNKKGFDDSVIMATIIWHNLSKYPISYIPDPSNPYTSVKSSDSILTDTVQFPRNTLKLKSGDCDDLTVLFATMFESVGAVVKILDYPGHIAVMFETKAQEISEVGLPDELIIRYENRYYVPIETTMLGKSFYESVKYAADMYKNAKDNVKVVDLDKAMSKFEPVTLPDMSDEFKLSTESTYEDIAKELDLLSEKRFSFYENLYMQGIKSDPNDLSAYINLGILYSGYGKLEEAEKIFNEILLKDEYNSAVINDLGNVFFIKGEYAKAAEYYEKASTLDPYDENIFINTARAYVKMGKKEEAKIFTQKAIEMNQELKSQADMILK